jgi:hypothetical protein
LKGGKFVASRKRLKRCTVSVAFFSSQPDETTASVEIVSMRISSSALTKTATKSASQSPLTTIQDQEQQAGAPSSTRPNAGRWSY